MPEISEVFSDEALFAHMSPVSLLAPGASRASQCQGEPGKVSRPASEVPESEVLPLEPVLASAGVLPAVAVQGDVTSSDWWSKMLQALAPAPAVPEEVPAPTRSSRDVVVFRREATKQEMLCARSKESESELSVAKKVQKCLPSLESAPFLDSSRGEKIERR